MENTENKKETKMDVKKMSIIAGIVAAVLVIVLILSMFISKTTGLNQVKDSVEVELGRVTELTLNAKDFFKVEDEVAGKIKFDVSEVDLEKVGEYKAYAKYDGRKYTIKVVVADTTAPKAVMEPEEDASYEEVFVILDTTGELINDVADQVVEVSKENLSVAPTLDESSGDKANTQNKNPGMTYDPADTNKDGVVDVEEQMGYITPEKQACIDAGYGVVVEMDGGKWYAVLMKNSEHTINGKTGRDILREYLQERDLEGHIGGCWIDTEKEWYWYQAEDIHELIGPDDEEYWEW